MLLLGAMLPPDQKNNFSASSRLENTNLITSSTSVFLLFRNAPSVAANLLMAKGPLMICTECSLPSSFTFTLLTRPAHPSPPSYRSKLKCNFLLLRSRHYPARTKQNTLIQLSHGQGQRQLPPCQSLLTEAKQESEFLGLIPVFFSRHFRSTGTSPRELRPRAQKETFSTVLLPLFMVTF